MDGVAALGLVVLLDVEGLVEPEEVGGWERPLPALT